MTHLPQEIGRLSAAEKIELLDALWEGIESDLPDPTAEEREEMDRREARYRQHPDTVISWEQVKADLLKRR